MVVEFSTEEQVMWERGSLSVVVWYTRGLDGDERHVELRNADAPLLTVREGKEGMCRDAGGMLMGHGPKARTALREMVKHLL